MKKLESKQMMQTGGDWYGAACSALAAIALHHPQIPTRITAAESYIASCLFF